MGRKGKPKRFIKPYIKYHDQPDVCQSVKNEYFKLKKDKWFNPRKIVSHLMNKYTVKEGALRKWTKKWEKSIDWDPFDTKNRGKCHRIFTDDQEKSMVNYIEDNYINPGNYFSDGHFQSLAFEAYDNIYRNTDDPPPFQCSESFIYKFKQKYGISSRLAHFKEREPNFNSIENSEDINIFKATIQSVIEKARQNNEPVLNADETGFQIFPNYIKTWAFKGSKNVAINVVESTKERLSVMATISSTYCKLPLFFISSANSEEESEEKIGELIPPNVSSYSAKSYMTTNCMLDYLQFIREQFKSNVLIHLIIDSYSSHTSQKVKNKAAELNIQLYFIPSGLTDILQPLDLSIFAPLKSITNKKIKALLFGNQNRIIGMKNVVRFIQEAYESLSIDNLINAWEQYQI